MKIIMRLSLLTMTLAFSMATTTGFAEPARPFPQHTPYALGTILPSHVEQNTLDAAVKTFYDTWKAKYLVQGCGDGRYYVFYNKEHVADDGTISISEGHGYGMLITALMAGYDGDAQVIFDGLYRFFDDHRADDENHGLMAWRQDSTCSSASDGNSDSATDGDMDIAYALLLADQQWGSAGSINYLEEAKKVIQAIKTSDTNPQTFTLTMGSWVSSDEKKYYYGTRSSDFMMDHLKAFEAATGDDYWRSVLNKTYRIIRAIQTTYSKRTGLLPDFIQNVNRPVRPATPNFLEGPTDGQYGYNACRDPWRIATDYLISGDGRAKTAVNKINRWIRTATGGDPEKIRSGGYRLNGTVVPQDVYVDMAFVAPLGVSAMADNQHPEWLNGLWDFVAARSPDVENYYGNSLKMLAMIVMTGNWWSP